MRIQHKVNHGWAPNRNDPEWEERVEREAERTTAATQRTYEKAQERLARAEAALTRAQTAPRSRRLGIARLAAVVEERRQELLDLHRLMTQTSQGSTKRGRGTHRGVPDGKVL